jgi:hypothetical protein
VVNTTASAWIVTLVTLVTLVTFVGGGGAGRSVAKAGVADVAEVAAVAASLPPQRRGERRSERRIFGIFPIVISSSEQLL